MHEKSIISIHDLICPTCLTKNMYIWEGKYNCRDCNKQPIAALLSSDSFNILTNKKIIEELKNEDEDRYYIPLQK